MSKQGMNAVRLVLKILVGLTFVVSAVAKMLGIDQFEIYVYSFGLFSMNTAFFLARIVIAGEFLLGVGLISNICNRLTVTTTLVVLLCFTLFLCYSVLIGRTDSCQCFGSWINISPTHSIIKNAVLILLTLLVSKVPSFQWRPKWYLWLVAIGVPLAAVFILSPLDCWIFKDKGSSYNSDLFDNEIVLMESFKQAHLDEDHKLLVFVTPHCPYCKMAIQKIHTFQKRYDIDSADIVYFIPCQFDTVDVSYAPYCIDDNLFIRFTYGERPLLMLLNHGKPVETYHYRNIDEAEIAHFLLRK